MTSVSKKVTMAVKSLPPEPVVPVEPLRVPLLDLRSGDCRWPLGDPRDNDFAFCGLPSLELRPYCKAHCHLASNR